MRRALHSPGKGLLQCGLMLILAMSMWIFFGDVAQAQDSADSCEIAHVQPKFPNWSGQGFEKHYIDGVEATNDETRVLENEISQVTQGKQNPDTGQPYLQCDTSTIDRFDAPQIEYKLVRSTGQYSRVTYTFRHLTTFIGCDGYTKQYFTQHPEVYEDFLGSYTKPGVMTNGNWLTRIEADGALSIDDSPNDWKIRESDQVSADQIFSTLRSGLQIQNEVSARMSNWYQLKTFSVDNSRLVAVSYRQMNTTLTASNQSGQGPASLQDANDIAKASLIFGIGQLLDHYRDFDKYKSMYYSVMLNGLDGVNDASDAGLVIADIGAIALEASPFTSFAISFVSWAKTVLPSSYNVLSHLFDPMVMSSPYVDQELIIAPEVEAAIRARYQNYSPAGTAYRLLALSWSPSISQIVIGGDKFQPNATLNFKFGLVGQEPLDAWNSTLVDDQSDTLFQGRTLSRPVPRGCYLISVVGPGTHGALQIAGNFIWIDGEPNYVPPQSITVTVPGSGSATPNRTCNNPVDVLTQYANLFNGANCGEDITWFSAHPENGPSANSSSLYVPTNSIVKVSSNDNGGGETACFTSTQEDLGSWKNKIQWAQLIPGGNCPVITADSYLVHTNQGDFRVNVGQTWDNTQHNRQILGFDRQGSAHLKINHVNGNQRCWDDSKSAQQLQNDGDWWIQTRSIEIGSGYCPGMNGQLQVFNLANYQGSQNDIRAGNSRTYSDNDLKYSFRFTEQGMSAKLTNADGRTRCWNTNVANLQDHEDYWHRTTRIEVFGTDVCPVPVEVPEGANFAPGSGVKYSYYEYISPMVGLPIPNIWTPASTGFTGNFAINQVPHRDYDFALRFETCLTVPSTGNYTFYTASDDGSELYINGQKVVDNDGYHSNIEKSGSINLTAGVHPLAVDFFQGGVDRILGVSWQGPNFAKQWIPNQSLAMTGCSWELKSQLPVTKPDMFAISKTGLTAGTTGMKIYSGRSNFSSVLGTYSTYVEEDQRPNYAWAFELADYNFDGIPDLYSFKKTGTGTGMTELHVLDGATNYRSFLLQTGTTLGATGYDYVWDFELGDYNHDNRLDAFAINKFYTGQHKVELHILNGATNFQTWHAHIVTALPEVANLDAWDFELADYDGDGNLDLYAFNKANTSSGKTELTIVKGPNFNSFALQSQLTINAISVPTDRAMELTDYNDDGVADLYVVDKLGTSGFVEVTIWDGSTGFQNSLASLVSAQPNIATGDVSWLFRFGKVPGQTEVEPTLSAPQITMLAVAKSGLTSGKIGMQLLDENTYYNSDLATYATSIEEDLTPGYRWAFELGPYNSDGILDLYGIKKSNTASGKTEVYVLNGADHYQSFLLQTPIPMGYTGTDQTWDFELGDYNQDGKVDIYAMSRRYTGTGTTEIHVLNGADNFQSFLFHVATPLIPVGSEPTWDLELGDFNGDGQPDLYAFNKVNTGSGSTEVSVINGPSFSSVALYTTVALGTQSVGADRDIEIADYNKDGKHDLFLIDKVGVNGVVEVTVLDGSTHFQSELASFTTMLPSLPSGDTNWLYRFGVFPAQVQGSSEADAVDLTDLNNHLYLPLITR